MSEIIDKRNFLKRLMSLCLLPFIPAQLLLNRKKPEKTMPLLQCFYHWSKKDSVLTHKKWYFINDRFSGGFQILNEYRTR